MSTQTRHSYLPNYSTPRWLVAAPVALLVVGGLVALVLGNGIWKLVTVVDPEAHAIQMQQEAALLPVRVAFATLWRAALLVGSVGVGYAALTWLHTRASSIYPDKAGLFPVVKVRMGGVTTIHDINRSTVAITSYSLTQDAGKVIVMPLDQPGQQIITLGALAVQANAAMNHPAGSSGNATTLPTYETGSAVPELPARVPLRGLLESAPSLNNLVLGVALNAQGEREIVTGAMRDLVHIAVGGSSGWGKSVFMRDLAWQAVHAIEEPYLGMIDLEGVTLAPFAQADRLLWPVADNLAGAQGVLRAVTDEIERRKALFGKYPGVDKLDMYNERASEPLKPLLLFVDEATALLADNTVQKLLREVVLRARKYGVWAILAGQDWKANSLDTAIRNQLATRIQFRAMSASQSRILLEQPGAENLDTPGRALAILPGREMLELQAPYLSGEMLVAGNGPQNAMPTMLVDDENLPDDERIRLLARQGMSKRGIEQRVYGYTGGAASGRVNAVLEMV